MPYIGKAPKNSVRSRFTYQATAGQTSFSGSDSNALTLSYVDSLYMDVYQNGVLLKAGTDYTATTGTTVVLVSSASADDVVEMVVYDVFDVADTYSTSNADSRFVNVTGDTMTGSLLVQSASSGATADSGADELVVEGSGHSGITILSGASSSGSIYFGDSGLNYDGYIAYSQSTRKMSFGTAGGNSMNIDADGHVLMPKQSAFAVYKTSGQNNIAINSGNTITWDAEYFDNNSDFASNTFTAPVTGKYLLGCRLRTDSVDSGATYYYIMIATSNRNYYNIMSPDRFSGDPTYFFFQITELTDMDANDTAYISFYQAGGTAQTDIDTGAKSSFWGHLVC